MRKKAVAETTDWSAEADRLEEEALEALAGLGVPRRRHLRKGESVDASFLGIPGAVMCGEGLEVLEYKDGSMAPIITGLEGLLEELLRAICLDPSTRLCGASLAFVRRFLKQKQSDFAKELGKSRETISRYETGDLEIPTEVSLAAKYLGMLALLNKPSRSGTRKGLKLRERSPKGQTPSGDEPTLKFEVGDKLAIEFSGAACIK